MAKKLSRRQLLGIGAASLAGSVALLGKESEAKTHGGSAQYQPGGTGQSGRGGRPHWEKSYSGGPIDVKPLPPALAGKG